MRVNDSTYAYIEDDRRAAQFAALHLAVRHQARTTLLAHDGAVAVVLGHTIPNDTGVTLIEPSIIPYSVP